MKCLEPIFDRRNNKTRLCETEVDGITGLQELENFIKHLKKKHGKNVTMQEALEYRAESGQ